MFHLYFLFIFNSLILFFLISDLFLNIEKAYMPLITTSDKSILRSDHCLNLVLCKQHLLLLASDFHKFLGSIVCNMHRNLERSVGITSENPE